MKEESPKVTNSEICRETTIDKKELNQEQKQTHTKWGDWNSDLKKKKTSQLKNTSRADGFTTEF